MNHDKVHIAMIGSTIEPVITGVIAIGATDIYPIISQKFWPDKLDELKQRLSKSVRIYEKVKGRELKIDPFRDDSFITILELILDIIESHQNRDAEFLINLTGGTKLMSAVAEAGAVLTKSTAYYVVNEEEQKDRENGPVILLPWHSLNPLEMDGKRIHILESLNKSRSGLSNTGIIETYPEEFTSRSMVHYLKELEKARYIERTREGRNSRNKITAWGRVALRIAGMR